MTILGNPILKLIWSRQSYLSLAACLAFCAPFFHSQHSFASQTINTVESIESDVDYASKAASVARMNLYLKAHPDDPDILTMRGRYALINDQIAEAEYYFCRALALSPDMSRARCGLAFCQIAKKDFNAARQNAARAVALNQLDPIHVMPDLALLKNLKLLWLKSGNMAEARAVDVKVKLAESVVLAHNCREQGVLDKTISILTNTLKIDPKLSYALLLRGVAYNNKSEHLKAIKDFDAVINIQPTLTTAYYLRGDSYFELGNRAKAVESWKQLLQLRPVAFPNVAAFCYTAMTGRLREHFEPTDETMVNHADIHYLCAVAESDLGQYDQAIKDYSECIILDPGEFKPRFERARLYERQGKDKLAMADLEQAMKLNPKYVEAIIEHAKILEKAHDNARAMADYTRVIAINPSDFGAYILRAESALRIKNYEQALSDYSKAAKLSPTDDDPIIGRAKVYTAMGRYDDALADYRMAIKINPHDRSVILDAMSRVDKLKVSASLPAR